MQKALIVTATGPINGTNTIFQTGAPYLPGSTVVFLNGRALRGDWDNGWIELGSDKIQMKEAPVLGDSIQVYFKPI